MQLFIFFVVLARFIALTTQLFHLIRGVTKDKDILLADVIQHLHIRAIQRTDSQRAVKGELHITGARRFGARQRDLLGKIRRRNDHLRKADAVVRDKDHFQLIADIGIVVDHLRDIVDKVNNVLRHVVSRGGFTGKDIDARHPLRRRIGLDPVIAGDDMQHIHQLTFVLMNTFDLHIEQRFRVNHHIKLLGDNRRQPLFVLQLGMAHRLVHRREIDMLLKLAQLAEIGTPGAADMLIQHFRERRVSQRQPAARRHAVGDVKEAHREDGGEIGEQRLHHQVRVQLRHAIHFMAHHDRQPRHTHAAAA